VTGRPRQATPRTVAARRSRIEDVIASREVTSQGQLRALLAAEGIEVSQGTLSRDLDAIGAIRQVGSGGIVRYAVRSHPVVSRVRPGTDPVVRVAADVLVGAQPAGNIAVLRTPPGAAQYLAGALDRSHAHGIVGTVAGDDTVLAVMPSNQLARALCDELLAVAGRGQGSPPGPARAARSPSSRRSS
jgi:transcriptional regulator of arginine metabolism